MTKYRWLVVTAAAGLLVAACGGDDGDAQVAAADDGGGLVLADDALADDEGALVADGGDGVVEADGADLVVADEPAETTSDGDSEEELALAFAQCMRDEGLVDWPDPELNADGSIELIPGGPGALRATDEGDVRDAVATCGPLVEGASFLPNRGQGLDAETQDQLLEFAQCLRDNGVDVVDPDLGGAGGAPGPGGIFGEGFDPDDPATQQAIDACQALFTGGPFGQGS